MRPSISQHVPSSLPSAAQWPSRTSRRLGSRRNALMEHSMTYAGLAGWDRFTAKHVQPDEPDRAVRGRSSQLNRNPKGTQYHSDSSSLVSGFTFFAGSRREKEWANRE